MQCLYRLLGGGLSLTSLAAPHSMHRTGAGCLGDLQAVQGMNPPPRPTQLGEEMAAKRGPLRAISSREEGSTYPWVNPPQRLLPAPSETRGWAVMKQHFGTGFPATALASCYGGGGLQTGLPNRRECQGGCCQVERPRGPGPRCPGTTGGPASSLVPGAGTEELFFHFLCKQDGGEPAARGSLGLQQIDANWEQVHNHICLQMGEKRLHPDHSILLASTGLSLCCDGCPKLSSYHEP